MRIGRFGIIVLFLITSAAAGPAVWASQLEGTVFDPSGGIVSGASVSLTHSLITIEEQETDSRGIYRFENLEDGIYHVAANARGLSSESTTIEIGNTEGVTQDIHLQLSAISSQVVVSASLGAALVPEIGSSVSVITQQEIEDRGAQHALEAIRGIPGIEVSSSGRLGGVTGVYIRGGESKYNAIMVDGIALNEFGGNFNFASLPAEGIERIEVTRGPQSALYGSNAVTGVINMVTRRGEGSPRFSAMAEGGSYSTRQFSTGGSGLTRGLSWSFNLSRLVSDGVVENDNYRNQSAFATLGYRQSRRRQLEFHFFGNANDAGAPGPYGSDPNNLYGGIDTVSRGKQNLFGYQLDYTEQFSRRFRQVTTVSFATNNLFYHSGWGDSHSDNLRGIVNTRSEITITPTNSLAAGFEFNREQIRNTYIADAQYSPFLLPRTSYAYFVEDRWNPTNRLYLIAGIRLDDLRTGSLPPDAWGTRPAIPATSVLKVNPRLSMAYILRNGSSGSLFGGTRIHGSFGTGIRPPDGFELAFTNNPDLKPERSTSFDAGVEQRLFTSRAVLDFTYFFNRFQDQIVTLGGDLSNLSEYSSDNLSNTRAQGFEISFRVHPTQSLELGGQYTFLASSILALDGSDGAKDPFEVGQPLIRRPRHSGSYNITWRYKRLILNTNAYIRSSVLDVDPTFGLSACSYGMPCFFTNQGYIRADAGFSYRLPHGLEIFGRINNFLNQKYEETFGYPALRLNFHAGMKFSFPSE